MNDKPKEEGTAITGETHAASTDTAIAKKNYYRFSTYRKHNAEVPSKILLVDDERAFVETLSERLQIRDMGVAVAFDAKSSMEIIVKDEPEVMIIDLNMPGINGMEMLRAITKVRPNIALIVLTGHGSKDDQEKCMEHGAFAYLQKPVDIDELCDILIKAHAKIHRLRNDSIEKENFNINK